jgi:hypothetical protein
MAAAKKLAPAKGGHPDMDTVLTRMLNTSPTPHLAPKPAKKAKPKKKAQAPLNGRLTNH